METKYTLGLDINRQQLRSSLQSLPKNPPGRADSLANRIYWNKYELHFGADLTYVYQKLKIVAGMPLVYSRLHTSDQVPGQNRHRSGIFFTPSFSAYYDLGLFTSLAAVARHNSGLGEISNSFTGYIMQSYRSLVRNDGQLPEKQDRSYQLRLHYRHPVHAVFLNIGADYFQNKTNLLYGYDYRGLLTLINSYRIDNTARGHRFYAQLSKGIEAIHGTVRLNAGYTGSTGNRISRDERVGFSDRSFRLEPALDVKIGSLGNLQYSFRYMQGRNTIHGGGRGPEPIRSGSQSTRLNLFPAKGVTFHLAHDYFYFHVSTAGRRTAQFADAALTYHYKTMQISLNYDNIFNTRQYISASNNETSSYYSTYTLRPAQVLLGLRFKIR